MKSYKNSFTLIEIIFVLVLLAIINSQVSLKNNISKLKLAKQQLVLHLKYLRYIAMIDNKYDSLDPLWFRKRWTLKFLNCKSTIGGYYYIIFSDENKNGYISKSETLRDPLSDNYIYSYQCNQDTLYDKSKFVLLTQKYDIQDIKISCNATSTVGQLSFGYDGNVYSRLSNNDFESYKFKVINLCTIKFKDSYNNEEKITIVPNTGQIY